MYPVMLDIEGKPCLVVGGGGVALRKINGLLGDGGKVRVIATEAMPAIEAMAAAGMIELSSRSYQTGDLSGNTLVLAACDDREVNRQIYNEASEAGIWANVADDPELCSFHLPARVQRGALQLTIASKGDAPFVVRRLRQVLEQRLGPDWAEWLNAARRFREVVRASSMDWAAQEAAYDAFFANTVDADRLTARVPASSEEAAFLAAPEIETATAASSPDASPGAAQPSGLVSLVGAGPGDAGLLTIRAHERLMHADVIVYDRLAATAVPTDLASHVELRCVGKLAGRHPVPQEETNELLIRLARQGRRVVRLKGGDPFVFGRGGEEAEALDRARIPFEVVPGISAGIAVPAYAGIPLTYRSEAVRATFLTAHETEKPDGEQQRWDLIATDKNTTIVGFMGVLNLTKVVTELTRAGMDPETPAAMIERGTTSAQRVVKSVISKLPDAVAKAGLRPPGLFVIGPVVERADALDWYGRRPLQGERLVMAAAGHAFRDELQLAGADVVEIPLPISAAALVVIDALPITGCIFKTTEEVDALEEERDRAQWSAEVIAYCLDEKSASRARSLGWQRVVQLDQSVTASALCTSIAARSS